MFRRKYYSNINNQSGAVAIITAILITVFLGFVALSVDTGHLVVTKNELQNAADAGALAGARELYNEDGTAIQAGIISDTDGVQIAAYGCNEIAYNTATANFSEKSAVEVNWTPGNNIGSDIERGHWSFGRGTKDNYGFTPSDSTAITLLAGVSDADLDDMDGKDGITNPFINAVRVTVKRESIPIQSFFSTIFGHDSFQQSATAVAYVGSAGYFSKGEFEIPMALCVEYLLKDPPPSPGENPYECGVAVMFESNENAMWSNLYQPDANEDGTYPACTSGNASDISDVVATGNENSIYIGVDVGVTNGIAAIVMMDLIDKWEANTTPDPSDPKIRTAWDVTMPIVRCFDKDDESEENTCAELVGGVEVKIHWMTKQKNAADYAKTPYTYYDSDGTTKLYECIAGATCQTNDYARWDEFAEALELVDENGDPLQLDQDKLYFEADCGPAAPKGGTGPGPNSGVIARRPSLVQ